MKPSNTPVPSDAKKRPDTALLFAVAARENQLSMLKKLALCLPQRIADAVNNAITEAFAEIEAVI